MVNKPQSVLSLHSIAFVLEKATILKDVTLDIIPGELFCLLGPSGSGKTTLLRIISGLYPPTRGRVEICGIDQKRIPAYRRNIGFVFQDPSSLLPYLTVFENVAFPLKVGRPRPGGMDIPVLVNRALEAVGLTPLANRHPNQLSGGEKQRVALARALVYEPAILLFDEPLASLDNISKEHLLQYISDLRKKSQNTCLYVTHDEREAFRLADRIGILDNGQLQQIATPTDLINEPRDANIARLTGAWNLLSVKCDLQKKTIYLPDGAKPHAIPLTIDDIVHDQVTLGFSVSSAKLASGTVSMPNHISLAGTVQETYVQSQSVVALIRIKNSLVKIRCSPSSTIPSPNDAVTCLIEIGKVKQYKK